jgi:tight adherence protein B
MMAEWIPWVLAGLTGVSVFLIFYGWAGVVERQGAAAERMRTFFLRQPVTDDASGQSSGLSRLIDRLLLKFSFGVRVARSLSRANIKMTITEYLVLHDILFISSGVVGLVIFGSPIVASVIAVLSLFIPSMYVGHLQQQRLQAFNSYLPDAMNTLANALRAGYSLAQAMDMVADEAPEPIAGEFRRVVTEVALGLPYALAFDNLLQRNPSPDLAMVITAIQIHQEVGGNLAEVLENISFIIRDRVRIQNQIRALTAQQRFSATVLSLLPLGMLGALYLVNKPYVELLWTTRAGVMLLGLAGVMLMVGVFLLRKISTIEV